MVKLRKDIKKIQILTQGHDEEVHYIERIGSLFVYSYLNTNGQGVTHTLKDVQELESFVSELYEKYQEYWDVQARSLNLDLKGDLEKIKEYLNV